MTIDWKEAQELAFEHVQAQLPNTELVRATYAEENDDYFRVFIKTTFQIAAEAEGHVIIGGGATLVRKSDHKVITTTLWHDRELFVGMKRVGSPLE